jgi:Flp pilus assembly protein TadD
VDHPADELTRMRAAVEKAIQLDPLLAEAHDALALAYARDGQWDEAEKSFRRAIELEPRRTATCSHFANRLLLVLGRIDEALELFRVAYHVDPASPVTQGDMAYGFFLTGRFDEAVDLLLKVPARDAFMTQLLGRARLLQGRFAEALTILGDGESLPGNPQARGYLGHAYARAGRREEAERMATASEYPNEQALIFAGLGDKERTLAALDRMTAVGAQRVGVFLRFPELALLRGDARLASVLRKAGLPR